MLNSDDLYVAIKEAAMKAMETSKPSDFIFGTVTNVSPLKISVEQKLTLGSAQLILTRNVTDYTVSVSMNWNTGSALSTHNHYINGTDSDGDSINLSSQDANLEHQHVIQGENRMTIHNALKVGEKVILLRKKGGQKYLVLDRVVNT